MLKTTLLLISAIILLAGGANCQGFTEVYSYETDLLKISLFEAETNFEHDLKLHKVTLEKRMGPSLLASQGKMEGSMVMEIVPCRELPSFVKQHKTKLNCHPNEVKDQYSRESPDTEYLIRITQRLNIKLLYLGNFVDFSVKTHLYPMTDAEAKRSIDLVLRKANSSASDFSKNYHGFYGKCTFTRDRSSVAPKVVGTGKVFIATNSTNDAKELGWTLFRQAFEDGMLISLQDFECSEPDYHQILSVKQDFTMILQQQFPYLFLRHSMVTSPLSMLFDYSAKVDQVTHEQGPVTPATAYNTSVRIVSKSIVPLFNFGLVQVFVNENSTTGEEEMVLTNPQLGTLIAVNSSWTMDSFTKLATLATGLSDEILKTPGLDINSLWKYLRTAFQFGYENKMNDDHVHFNFAIKRDLLPWSGLLGRDADGHENDLRDEL